MRLLERLVRSVGWREVMVVCGADLHVALGASTAHVEVQLRTAVAVHDLLRIAEVTVGALGAHTDEDAEAATSRGPQELVEEALTLLFVRVGDLGRLGDPGLFGLTARRVLTLATTTSALLLRWNGSVAFRRRHLANSKICETLPQTHASLTVRPSFIEQLAAAHR